MIMLEQARELLRQAVATQGPDFVYNPDGNGQCFYRPSEVYRLPGAHGRPAVPLAADDPRRITGCLIGVALDLAGETRHHDRAGGIHGVAAMFPDMMSRGTASYFAEAQSVQDNGGTWGEALAAAEALLSALSLTDYGI